ncbi:MAG: tetratricopeptide repeat protein, partial [Burkholderiales bacterium]
MRALSRLLAALCIALLALGGARAQLTQPLDEEDDGPPAAAAAKPGPRANLPLQELSEPILYEFLLSEIALQRGVPGLAAQSYVELAKRTRDPRIARRAVEIANHARMANFALEAALVWHEADPNSPQALQTVTLLLVGAKRVDEAEPYLAKLLAADGTAAANGFMQLGRLLAGNPDQAANLRVVQR